MGASWTGRPLSSTESPLYLTIPGLERPGLVHAFSTRRLGQMRRTEEELLTLPRRRFAQLLGLDPDRMSFAGAVHGGAVARVDRPLGVAEGCDALVTAEPGLALFATYADCYPVVLFDPVRRAAGIVHAGWRGTAVGVAANAVRALESEFGSRPADILAGIGPGICGRCYEVGAEVARRFDPEVVRARPDGKSFLDLAEANHRALVDAGVPASSVYRHGSCTREDGRLPSHRRDADGGRYACIVAIQPA